MSPVSIVKLHDALKRNGVGAPSIAIAGFSGRGLEIALFAKKAGFKIVAVSDESCSVVDMGGNGGLDINKLIELKGSRELKDLLLKNVIKAKASFLPKIEVDALLVEVLEEGMAEEVRARVVIQYNKGKVNRKASKVLQTKQVPVLRFSIA